MNILTQKLILMTPMLVNVFAEGEDTGIIKPAMPDWAKNLLSTVAGIMLAVGIGFLAWSIIKDLINMSKGSGASSWWGVIGKAVIGIVLIALFFFVLNWGNLQKIGNGITSAGETILTNLTNSVTPGGGTGTPTTAPKG